MHNQHVQRNVLYAADGSLAVSPPGWVEAAYYAAVVYAIMCQAWNISIPLLGPALIALLALYTLRHLERGARPIHRALLLPYLCSASFIAIQVGYHGQSLIGAVSRAFIIWIFGLMVIQSLMLRPGFLHRFAVFAFCLGLMVLPYTQLRDARVAVQRVGLQRDIGIANPNEFAAWLGFCAVFFAVLSLETKRQTVRIMSAAITIVSLMIVGLTVSRGTLLAVAVAVVMALRRTLKKGFFPLLIFCSALWAAYGFGLFDRAIGGYAARAVEESGRLVAWPLAIRRFLSAPFMGVGESNRATYVPSQGGEISTHNSFLFFGLSSGIVPLALFVTYWVYAGLRATGSKPVGELNSDQPFRVPLIIYLLLICQADDYPFMTVWGMVVMALAMSVIAPRRVRRPQYAPSVQSARRRPPMPQMPAKVPQ